MSRLYKSVLPQSQQESYSANSNIEFVLNFPNESIKQGSIRLCGALVMTNLDANTQIDAQTGIHSAFNSIVTSFNGRVVESLNSYPRIHKMKMQTRQDDPQTIASSLNLTSLKLARDEQTTSFLQGAVDINNLPFSCKLNFVLNNTNSDVPFSKTGVVRIQIRTSSDVEFMTNKGTSVYSLKNLEMWYQVDQDGGKGSGAVMATTYHLVKHTINSNSVAISTKVPAKCESAACSFILASEENSDDHNNLKCAELPSVSRVQWNINDEMSIVKYSVESPLEILLNYLRAMGSNQYNNFRVPYLQNEERVYGIGLDFFGAIDLSQNALGLEIVSAADNTTPYSMFMYFRSVVSF